MDSFEFVRGKGLKMCSGQLIWRHCILKWTVYPYDRDSRGISSTDYPAWIYQYALTLL